VLHTFLADDDGRLLGDCLVANNDTEFLFLCENLVADAEFDTLLQRAGAAEASVQDLAASHTLLSLDGFKAWEVVKKIFGPDVLGLPYLSIENYSYNGEAGPAVPCWQDLGVWVFAARPGGGGAGALRGVSIRRGAVGGTLCGVDVHDDLRLEGRFFNISRRRPACPRPAGFGPAMDD